MSAQNVTPKYPVIGIDSSNLTAFCQNKMTPPEQYWYYLIEKEKEERFDKNEKRKNRSGSEKRRYFSSRSNEPDPELDKDTVKAFKRYKKFFEESAEKEGWVDFLMFLNLDEKKRAEHLELLKQQRYEHDKTLELIIKTKATFTKTETEKVLAKAREYGIEEVFEKEVLYDTVCWKKMVEIHKDLSTIDKIWGAVANMPEGYEKYRTLFVIYSHVHTIYLNYAVDLYERDSYEFFQEHMFKAFLNKCLFETKFDEKGYNYHSITYPELDNRPRQEYMRIVKTTLLEKVAKNSAERKSIHEAGSNSNPEVLTGTQGNTVNSGNIQNSDSTQTNAAATQANPVLYSQQAQQTQQLQTTPGSQQRSDQQTVGSTLAVRTLAI